MTHRLRSWFLRGVLEALKRQYGTAALSLLNEKVPRRLLGHTSLERLRSSASLDTISLDDGEELLLFIDSLLGDGVGRVLENIGQELASRALHQGGVAKFGDLHGTVARLQAFLDHPFVDAPTVFELKRTDLGFSLTVGVTGRPRATRVLRHLTIGAVNAAERAAREGTGGLKLSSELLADRATLLVSYQRAQRVSQLGSDPPPASVRRPVHAMRPLSLSEEVERILTSHRSQGTYAPRSTPMPRSYGSSSLSPERSSQPPPERPSDVQPLSRHGSEVPHLAARTSEVQPIANRTATSDERTSWIPDELKRSTKG